MKYIKQFEGYNTHYNIDWSYRILNILPELPDTLIRLD